jgi:hypothetical protein
VTACCGSWPARGYLVGLGVAFFVGVGVGFIDGDGDGVGLGCTPLAAGLLVMGTLGTGTAAGPTFAK